MAKSGTKWCAAVVVFGSIKDVNKVLLTMEVFLYRNRIIKLSCKTHLRCRIRPGSGGKALWLMYGKISCTYGFEGNNVPGPLFRIIRLLINEKYFGGNFFTQSYLVRK